MRQAGEPSVEEILSSIKKVIARDNRVDSGRRALAPGDDVLDLSEVATQVPDPERATNEESDEPLLNPVTASAMRESLAALAMLSQPGAQPQIVRSGETSLEGLTRELLRPMLAEWLDQHLPAMVDRLVTAEITRIVRKKG